MMEVFRTYVTIARPIDGNDPGRIEVGHYVIDGDNVTLTDKDGVPVVQGRMQIGYAAKIGDEEPDQVARRLLWRHYRATKSGSDFNRPLRYPNLGIV
jgi:hypothetical protein